MDLAKMLATAAIIISIAYIAIVIWGAIYYNPFRD